LRVAFAGTPPFAATALEAIFASGHSVPLVLTQPDRPGGRRGLKLTPSAVAQTSERLGLATIKVATLREPAGEQALRDASPDVMVVAAYGLLLPPHILTIPPHGCINIHASLLPRWRGAAPIQRAMLAGDQRTGISIMQMDAGLDTGPVLLAESLEIGKLDTAGTLTQSLALLGARLVVEALASLDHLRPCAQDADAATYAPKITKGEAGIDWTQPALAIERKVRAFQSRARRRNSVCGGDSQDPGCTVRREVGSAFASHRVRRRRLAGGMRKRRPPDQTSAASWRQVDGGG
jgi:methionyl-tRNA formyltransferase